MPTKATEPIISHDGVDWKRRLETGETLTLRFREIRREKTGIHALVAVMLDGVLLEHDTFNIGRREDRQRLGNAAYKMMKGKILTKSLGNEALLQFMATAALGTPYYWEQQRLEIVQYAEDDEVPQVQFVVKPYITFGGGTIFFAPPKSGKSTVLQSVALAVAKGYSPIYTVSAPATPVLYVNLERSADSFLRRERALKRALGITGPVDVYYLHARGMSLNALRRKIIEWLDQNPISGIIVDSISRAQTGGDLTQNDTGNKFIDLINSTNPAWWAAAAHTPRQDASHIYGTIMFQAGMDIGVKVSHEKRDNILGICLELDEANDLGNFPREYLAFEFNGPDEPVSRARKARDIEFPELALEQKLTKMQRIEQAIQESEHGNMTAVELAKVLNLNRGNISTLLSNTPNKFHRVGRQGKRGVAYELVF